MSFMSLRLGLTLVLTSLPLTVQSGGLPNMVPSYMEVEHSSSGSEPWKEELSTRFLDGAAPKNGAEIFEFGVDEDVPRPFGTAIFFRQFKQDNHRIRRLRILVDNNAQPIVADYRFGPEMARIDLLSQVCLENFSAVRAVVTDSEGDHFELGRYLEPSQVCHETTSPPSGNAADEILLSFPNSDGAFRAAHLEFVMSAGTTNLADKGGLACRVSVSIDGVLLFDMSGDRAGICGKPISFSFVGDEASALTVRADFASGATVERVFALGS